MKIIQITVSAGRVIPSVSLVATVEDGEDPVVVTRKLQAQAEQLVEDHKDHPIGSIHQLEEMATRDREIRQLEQMITNSQTRLEQLRSGQGLGAGVQHSPRAPRRLQPWTDPYPDPAEGDC